jgi:ferredoxin
MAEQNKKWPDNFPGPFYVDEQCIACDACVKEAPSFFKMNMEEGHAFVKKQPQTNDEKKMCNEALKNCPVDAIGSNGTI